MTSCRIHAATTDIETVLARLLPVCHCLSQDISIQESSLLFFFILFIKHACNKYITFCFLVFKNNQLVFRTSHSQTIETSELRVVQDTIRNQTFVFLLLFIYHF